MREFEPSTDFVLRVMDKVYSLEASETGMLRFGARLFGLKPFRYAMSGAGALFAVFLSPALCI